MQLFEFTEESYFVIFPWLRFSLKILNSEHFYGAVQFIPHFVVSPRMAADAISVSPFFWTGNVSVTFQMFWALHWQKPFTGNNDQMHMLWPSLAGLMDMFVIFLSPSALYSGQTPWESDLIHCQSSIPFPSLAVARREQRSTIPAVPACRHARAGLYHPVGWQSTWGCYPVPDQLQQVLSYVVRKHSVFKRSGALTISQVIHKWPFKCLSN